MMRLSLQFQFERDAHNRFGISVVAVGPDGEVLGQPAQIHDAVFSTPEEAADRLVCAIRGAFRNPVPGFFPHDFLRIK